MKYKIIQTHDKFIMKLNRLQLKSGFTKLDGNSDGDAIIKDLNLLWIVSYKIKVNFARFRKEDQKIDGERKSDVKRTVKKKPEGKAPDSFRDHRTFLEAVKGVKKNKPEQKTITCNPSSSVHRKKQVLKYEVVEDNMEWLKRSAVAYAKSLEIIHNLHEYFSMDGFSWTNVRECNSPYF